MRRRQTCERRGAEQPDAMSHRRTWDRCAAVAAYNRHFQRLVGDQATCRMRCTVTGQRRAARTSAIRSDLWERRRPVRQPASQCAPSSRCRPGCRDLLHQAQERAGVGAGARIRVRLCSRAEGWPIQRTSARCRAHPHGIAACII